VLLCITAGITERRAFGRVLDENGGLSSLLSECLALRSGAITVRIQHEVDVFGSGRR
jgi:hypothetical protein